MMIMGGGFKLFSVVVVVVLAQCIIGQGAGAAKLSGNDYENYAQFLLANGVGRTPPMGWNSWNHFHCQIDEWTVKATADALVSTGLAALGYKYVNIDDCWAERRRDSNGKLAANQTIFPSGMKALADYVHARGLKLGIYGDAGYHSCNWRVPGSLGHEEDDARTLAEWEIDYFKYDNCDNRGIKPRGRYENMSAALFKVGRPIFFSLCEWGLDNPATWARRLGSSWRTTEDIKDQWASVTLIADKNNVWARYAGPGGWNDPDMLEVGNGVMKFEEYRSHFSIWALMKAPLLIGCDVRNASKETLSILGNKEVIDVNQDPLGVQGKKICSRDDLEVWAGPLSGKRIVVVLWNRSRYQAPITVSWKDIGLSPSEPVSVRDLWAHSFVSRSMRGELTADVASHDCKMYILTPVEKIKKRFKNTYEV